MTPGELLAILRHEPLAVVSSVTSDGVPQAAVVGIAISDDFKLIFDTLANSRKHANLVRDPRVALVIGWDRERTVQCEGVAEQPTGAELTAAQAVYFSYFPDGRSRLSWPGITYWLVRPTWIRFSDFNIQPPVILEWNELEIRGWSAAS